MIDFTQETYQNILQAMLDRVPDTYDKRDTAPIPTALGPTAFVMEGFYLSLDQVQRQAFVQTASGQSLDYLAVIAGLTLKAAKGDAKAAKVLFDLLGEQGAAGAGGMQDMDDDPITASLKEEMGNGLL